MPLIGVSEVGDPRIPALGLDLDIRTDVPGYRVWKDGDLVDETTDLAAWWRDDLVSFVLGCSFSFEQALIEDGLPMRHMASGLTVPMYRTDIACVPAGPFWGPMVVSMRPFPPAQAIRAIQIVAQDAGFSESSFYDAVGDRVEGVISRASFALDLAAKRPSVGKVNELFKARSGKDLNDATSREFMGLLILADAIDRAKTIDGEKIREALAATDLPGERTIMPWKQVKFDEAGQNNDADPVLLQYVKGTFVTIFPAPAATAEAIWPMSPPAPGN